MCRTVVDVKSLLANPEFEIDVPVTGIFGAEIGKPSSGRNGVAYYPVYLWDYTGSVRAFAPMTDWQEIHPGRPATLECGIELQRDRNGQVQAVLHPTLDTDNQRPSIELLPGHVAPNVQDLERLVDLANALRTPAYRAFLENVFRDLSFTQPFVTLPASKSCHHTDAGGLLAHSLEVAEALKAATRELPNTPVLFAEAAVVVALLHDAGKVLLRGPDGHRYPCRHHEHDKLLEFALSAPLTQLKETHKDAAGALWGTIKAYQTGDSYNMPLAGVIRGLDGTSAQNSGVKTHLASNPGCYWTTLGGRRPVWIPPAISHTSVP
ncbi:MULTISPECIES: TraI domain-containing protein [unclassified Thioalkalivibrio]|uniref:TraI domain-containing protein n=1 Tax=unclassified Thioalkalivibrio TaxID=2621013 RepID=UPI0003615502|nr:MULTISPECIES: TraI domain-containing protein [unclassified Thioalkalivibrio]